MCHSMMHAWDRDAELYFHKASWVRRMPWAGQGRSPTSAESGVAWTLLREEPPGGQAMDLPRGEWRTAILAGEAGARPLLLHKR